MAAWTPSFSALFIYFCCANGMKVSVRKLSGNVTHMKAEIRREDLDTGSPYNEVTKLIALNNTSSNSDVPGLLIPGSLGGQGNETYNVVPFSEFIYDEYWAKLEDIIYDFVNQEGMVFYQIFVFHNGTRPRNFAIIAQTEDELSNRTTTYKVYKAFISNSIDFLNVLPDKVSLVYTEPYENLIGPIKHCGRGYKTKVEYLRAFLDDPSDLEGGMNSTEELDKYAKNFGGTESDTAVTLLTAALGGPGNETYNIVPMSPETRELWTSQQGKLSSIVKRGGQLDSRMWVLYGNAEETRPSVIVGIHIMYPKSGGEYYQSFVYKNPRPWASPEGQGTNGETFPSSPKFCSLPEKLNGTQYKFQDARNSKLTSFTQESLTPESSVLIFSCEEGYAFPEVKGKRYNSRSRCKQGKWTKQHKCIRVPRDGECTLPPTTNTTSFKVAWCADDDTSDACLSVEGTIVRQYTVLNYTCADGYVHPRQERKPLTRSFCLKGIWYPPKYECLKTCAPMSTETMETECEFEGKSVPCDEPAHQGTLLRPKCKPFYRPQKAVTAYNETECMKNGEWGYELYKCIPDCGLIVGGERRREENSFEEEKKSLSVKIEHGVNALTFEAPWHAGLFRFNDETGNFSYFCGGSIISPHFILTAAHCIYDANTEEDMFPEDIQVVVGKQRLSWDDQDPLEQRIGVGQIHTLEQYKGGKNYYIQDASLLELERVITLTHVAIPVCIDWLRDGIYTNGTVGKIVGFGRDETGKSSSLLKMAQLSYIDYKTCYERAPIGFHNFLHYDKFCAGSNSQSGTSTQQGDSGGGFTFIRGNRHFLYGVLSSRPLDSNRFAVYTNVSLHLVWLHRRLSQKEFGTEAYVKSYEI